MLKKLFKIGMLAGLVAVACTANAQETKKNLEYEYPKYGFWSNWSIGVTGDFSLDMNEKSIKLREGSNLGLGIFAEKELNHVWAARLDYRFPGLLAGKANTQYMYIRYSALTVDIKMSLTGLAKGYNPERTHNWYLIAGAGLCFNPLKLINADESAYRSKEIATNGNLTGRVSTLLDAGIGYSYDLSEKFTIFGEATMDMLSNVPDPKTLFKWELHDIYGALTVGLMYNFGATQTDLDLIAQRALLTQENFDRMSDEIDGLRKDLRESKEREAKLINRVNELEDKLAHAFFTKPDDGTADSLRRVIENYENNKHNYYALPFSINYAVDQYTVPADQMGKVNALAQILKDNEDLNIEIIGYCDYSGSDEYNQKLSEKRAEYVKKLLVRKGIDESRLTTSGKGKTMPFGDIKNPINRRTSFYRVNK